MRQNDRKCHSCLSTKSDSSEENQDPFYKALDKISKSLLRSKVEDWSNFQLQSTVQDGGIQAPEFNSNNKPNQEMAEVVQFLDENQGEEVKLYSTPTPYQRNDAYEENSSLANFLSRPVRIASYTWLESDPIGLTSQIFQPWSLFFNDTRIKYKLNNYAFIRCNLRIKIVINASPFYYGALMCSYQPLTDFNKSTIYSGSGLKNLIPYSQRPHVWLYPQNNEGGEMTLPFFYQKDWLRVAMASDFSTMGTLSFINYTQLASANGASGTGCTVQIYAWAEDVIVSGPTLGLALTQSTKQRKDEYTVSGIASAVSEAMGSLARIPIIKSFATTTQMGADFLAMGARALGFTNVPVISDVLPLKPVSNTPFAVSDIGYPIEKLTLDAKNELSIDPAIVGLSSEDEFDMQHLVARESYLTAATWSTTNLVDDILFYCPVGPQFMFDTSTIPIVSATASTAFHQTPVCWLSQMFGSWRGDMIFRFRIVASQYHKGRFRISFDPAGYSGENIVTDNTSTSVIYNSIIDLGKDSNIEMRIPFNQALPWLSTFQGPASNSPPLWSTSLTPTFQYNDSYNNGSITLRCLTTLTAPVATSSVKILVSVRGAENLEFGNPCNQMSDLANVYSGLTTHFSLLPPQSSMMPSYDGSGISDILIAGTKTNVVPERYLANFGESIQNLRQILRRTSLVGVLNYEASPAPTTPFIVVYASGRLPQTFGYDSHGADSARGQGNLFTTSFNWNTLHPITYIASAFVGTRGSVNWSVNAEPGTFASVKVYRVPTTIYNYQYGILSSTAGFTNSQLNAFYLNNSSSASAGLALTNQQTQAGLAFQAPQYSNILFQSTNAVNTTTGNGTTSSVPTNDEYQEGYHLLEISSTPVTSGGIPTTACKIWRYAGAGTDFTCHFFLSVPTLFYYGVSPIAV